MEQPSITNLFAYLWCSSRKVLDLRFSEKC